MQVLSDKMESGIESVISTRLFLSNQTVENEMTTKNLTPSSKTVQITPVPHPNNSRFQDITGQRFGRLTVIAYAGFKKPRTSWFVRCDCGEQRQVESYSLKRGESKSCGCLSREMTGQINRTHGETSGGQSKEYICYSHAKARCQNPNDKEYANYGGRGIEFRFDSIEQFLRTVGRKPSSKHSIDRIDVNGHYEIGNVRWATSSEQARNRRSNRIIELNGVERCLIDWLEIAGIKISTARERMRRGWCDECSITIPASRFHGQNTYTGKKCEHN